MSEKNKHARSNNRSLLARLNRPLQMRLFIIILSAALSYLFAIFLQPEFALYAIVIGSLTSGLVSIIVDRLINNFRQIIRRQNQQLRLQNEELIAVNALLEESNRELKAYSYTVAHDIKSPVASIVMSADLMSRLTEQEEVDVAKVRGNSDRIAASSKHVANIVDELLLLATVSEAKIDLVPVKMAPVVDRAMSRVQAMILEKRGQLVIAEDWPEVCSYGPWLEEVWVNYLSNGLKYGGQPPELELGVNLLADNLARFWVRDNGPGIPLEQADTLFHEFSQADMRTDGHGLGLSIVYRIVRRLGGDVGVESHPGAGSLFYFTLPLA